MHAGLPLLQERTYPTYPSIISYMQYLRVELGKLKMDSKKIIDVLLSFRASELCLYNVTRQSLDNNYFECAKLQEQKKIISNGISLRIKSTPPKQKELDVTTIFTSETLLWQTGNEKDEENVQIEMGRKQTITCTTTANATNFQWFKVRYILLQSVISYYIHVYNCFQFRTNNSLTQLVMDNRRQHN